MFKGYNILRGINLGLNTELLIYKKRKLVNLPVKIIYDTIIDIPNYHKFVPFCHESNWLDEAKTEEKSEINDEGTKIRNALLTVNFLLFKESYVSKVIFQPYNFINAMAYDSEIFERLDTRWNLSALESGTAIDFSICYRFRNPFYQHLSNTFNNTIAKTMLTQFIKECTHRHNSTPQSLSNI
ncbi:Polyketide cyclase / dehydrase and lipid transport family protein [Theileria parva strain Muguga]|uniref:Coenzyme Q-binding protein COQ10 START domain-containing protein n=1 Tax=Theileria parva TaxID=5875 RepID=Q4MYL0_THEPA|nr:Polyketide cyclase / dehydrase and lipid transport family protein [Theileria parva strain Muguga]EAN30672.1 Polyketide cyclase / dehydrase and lipid transport family protein [Theileria parva strain Muguga]|eukprot:XP_762955.1 hypothetical protein [Theileria parva strain Muguga]